MAGRRAGQGGAFHPPTGGTEAVPRRDARSPIKMVRPAQAVPRRYRGGTEAVRAFPDKNGSLVRRDRLTPFGLLKFKKVEGCGVPCRRGPVGGQLNVVVPGVFQTVCA